MNMWYFYILQSQKNQNYFYKGSTNDLERRLEEHNKGLTPSNSNFRPFRIVYFEAYLDEETARLRERSVKRSGSVSVPLLKRIRESLNTHK
ncbi:GIY-YIG nuclease family protein [Candidatus Uhrbacteria bacterium]|nr:GIY-YIG nuclease family protein [Candidatus Uhrbacteria bacterium]